MIIFKIKVESRQPAYWALGKAGYQLTIQLINTEMMRSPLPSLPSSGWQLPPLLSPPLLAAPPPSSPDPCPVTRAAERREGPSCWRGAREDRRSRCNLGTDVNPEDSVITRATAQSGWLALAVAICHTSFTCGGTRVGIDGAGLRGRQAASTDLNQNYHCSQQNAPARDQTVIWVCSAASPVRSQK